MFPWFGRLKQLNPSNSNVDVFRGANEELDELIPELPLIDRDNLFSFRQQAFNDLFALALKLSRKCHERNKIRIHYTVAATVIALTEAAQCAIQVLASHDQPAATLLKRHIKEKVAAWK